MYPRFYSIQAANHRQVSFRKKDKVLLSLGVVLFIAGLIIAYPYSHDQPTPIHKAGVFIAGIFGAGISLGIISGVLELVYLIFKYPKDWLGKPAEPETETAENTETNALQARE